MRPPVPEVSSDPFFDLIGQRVAVNVDGNVIKGRLLSCRDGFLTLQEDRKSTQDNLEQVRNFQHNRGAAAHFLVSKNHKDVLEVNASA